MQGFPTQGVRMMVLMQGMGRRTWRRFGGCVHGFGYYSTENAWEPCWNCMMGAWNPHMSRGIEYLM